MTEREYIEHLESLEASRCKHPLMRTLRKGFSKANAVYLHHLLKSQPAAAPAPAAPFNLKVLYVRKSKLFGQRASLSNKMCDLPEDPGYDKQRAKYSDQIQAVQEEIEEVMEQIEAAERGDLPPAEKPELPATEAELIRRLASLRASRSRQRNIEKIARGEKLEKCRTEIGRLEKLITDVETALSEYN